MAKANFILQGLKEELNHKNVVKQVFEHEEIERVIISTAFLRSTGIDIIESELKEHAEKTQIFVGIRNGITSKQAVEKVFNTGASVILVDTGTQRFIFHPKTYLVICSNFAYSIVGSANLTSGGMANNLEASTILELDKRMPNDNLYVNEIEEAFDNMIERYEDNVFLVDDIDVINELFSKGLLVDENTHHSYKSVTKGKVGDTEVTPIMKLKTEKVHRSKLVPTKAKPKEITIYGNVDISGMSLTEMWSSKELTERDLNIPTGNNTNITGSMTLKKGEYTHIDQRHYFREDVFNGVTWKKLKPKKPHLEYADVKVKFIIESVDYGEYTLQLKHDIRTNTRSYEQSNAMTHLLWKDAKDIIRNQSLLYKKLKLYKDNETGTFVIIID